MFSCFSRPLIVELIMWDVVSYLIGSLDIGQDCHSPNQKLCKGSKICYRITDFIAVYNRSVVDNTHVQKR